MENNILLSLPDEVLQHILSLVPLDAMHSVLFVCRRLSKLVRQHILSLVPLVPTIHLFSVASGGRHFVSASMPLTTDNFPNQNWSPTTHQSLHVNPTGVIFHNDRTNYSLVSLGRSVYVIGRYNYLNYLHCRYDTWTKTTSSIAPFRCCGYSMAASVNGKIYAVGISREYVGRPIGEYEPVTNEWGVITHITLNHINIEHIIAVGAGGVFYMLDCDRAGLMAGYEPGAGEWVGGMPKQIMPKGWVVCACGMPAGHVYMISCHEVEEEEESFESRFWRWEGSEKEWIELEAPVIPRSHHFLSLVMMKNEMVVAIVNEIVTNSSFFSECIGKYVLPYDVAGGRWGRRIDLPPEFNSVTTLASTDY